MSTGRGEGVTPGRRFLLGGVLATSSAFVGFCVGTFAAARTLVPSDAGLAGPAEAIAYGLGAALTLAAISVALAWRWEGRKVARAAVGASIGAVLCLLAVMARVMTMS